MMIVNAGRSSKKMFPDIIGKSFNDIFVMVRPGLRTLVFDSLDNNGALIVFRSIQHPVITLRGSMNYLQEQEQMLFTGTPWFRSMDEIKENNLTLQDFSVSDPMIDLLHVLKTEEIVSKEVRELLEQVNNQKKELQTTAERLGQLIRNLQTGILLEDENRRIILTNQIFCDMFDIPLAPDSMIGMDCSNSAEASMHMFNNPQEFVHRIDVLIREKVRVGPEILELTDGRYYERDYIPLFVNDTYRGHLWRYSDITERMRQQDLLRKSEEKYRGIITNINLGLIEVDLDEKIQYANKSFCDISGYDENEIIGKRTIELFELDAHAQKILEDTKKKRSIGISDVYELPVYIKNREKRWWAISGAPLYDDFGNLIGSIGIHLDITKQKLLENELRDAKNLAERSAEAKESFLANMSHEIRTPLSGIYGMMQLLANTRLDKEQESYIQSINKAIQNLQAIINDILDFSKINAGMLQLEEIEFSLKEEITLLYQLMYPKAREKGLSLKMKIDDALEKWYTGDPHRIGQILNNVVGNAVKFTDNGEITIHCRLKKNKTTSDWVEIVITDTGIGMDTKFLNSIFDKFTQEDTGHSRKFGGTGLGMSISRHLIDLMKGEINVESKKFSGTTVTIALPLKKATGNNRTPEKIKNTGKLTNNKIIVAEDNEINAQVVINMLKQEGAKTVLVKNGKELIDTVRKESFDIIISDLQMPVMDGLEAARWIRKNIKEHIRLVALTANVLSKEKKRCMEAGFDQVVFKPFRKEELLKACFLEAGKSQKEIKKEVPSGTGKLYNLEDLKYMIDNDPRQLKLLIKQFVKETPGKLKNLEKAGKGKDQKEIKRIAHYLLSSVQHMGIASCYETIQELDQQKFIRSPKKMEQAIGFIAKTLTQAVEQMKKDFRIKIE